MRELLLVPIAPYRPYRQVISFYIKPVCAQPGRNDYNQDESMSGKAGTIAKHSGMGAILWISVEF